MVELMLQNLIRIDNPDTPIYRTFHMKYLRTALQEKRLILVAPYLWDDPFENILERCAITYTNEPTWRQEFFDQIRKPMFAQCWSHIYESDAAWRIYSAVDKDPNTGRNTATAVEMEGVKVRTTARKLLTSLWNGCPADPVDTCFLGQIQYMSEEKVKQFIADEIGRGRLQAFPGGRGHAESLLFKREPFEHEQEIRLIYVEYKTGARPEPLLPIPINPNELFEEMILDPRLQPDDVREREKELHDLGYLGHIAKSDLYQKTMFEIIIP